MRANNWWVPLSLTGAFLLGIGIGFQPSSWAVGSKQKCPDTTQGETAEDCPWAGTARAISRAAHDSKSVLSILKKQNPAFYSEIDSDARRPDWVSLWGQSINFDEFAKGVVVEPKLIQALEKKFGVTPRKSWDEKKVPSSEIMPAGIEHTYGYLFSTLKTPYGFKRGRWVKPTFDQGFGLPERTLGPTPKDGTLFSNVTYFIGRIAFRDQPKKLAILEKEKSRASKAVTSFDYSSLKVSRLDESVEVPSQKHPGKSRLVQIRTDLVPFKKTVAGEKNSHILIYSIVDPEEDGAKLITAFPVEKSFVEMLLNPKNMGDHKPVISRYNGYIAGLSGRSLEGKKQISGPGKVQ